MNEVIKHRIDTIQRGEVPDGYKKRGKSIFPVEWKTSNFERLGLIQSGLVDPTKEPYLYMQHIGPDCIEKDTGRLMETQSSVELGLISGKFYFDSNSIVYSKIRPNLNKVCIPDFEGICSADCYAIKPRDGIYKTYLFKLMLSFPFYKQAVCCSMRTGMPKINQDDLNAIPLIHSQNIEEQQKIAGILTTQDKIIELKEKRIADKHRQKKYLMQQLLTGKKRLEGFSGEWIPQKIGSCIYELNERTTESNQHEILSVTKNGIVRQSDHFNKQIASEDNAGYKILRRGNLAFSSMNLWMGSLDVLEICDEGIISPAYKVFDFNISVMLSEFGKHFMKSNHMIWLYICNSEQGASIVRRNLDLNGLLSTFITIPELKEQKAIANILSTADNEILLLQQDLEQEKQKKKALMQLLLTGIVRVTA